MMKNTIHDLHKKNQVTKDGNFMNFNWEDYALKREAERAKQVASEIALMKYVKRLIREEAKKSTDGYTLYSTDLNRIDQQVFLSYIVEADLYDFIAENPMRINVACEDFLEEMQFYIDKYIHDVYLEDMRDLGIKFVRDWHHGDFVKIVDPSFDPYI